MKIIMKTSDDKGGSSNGHSAGNPKIRIAVIGQHEVGKSALTVRYLTRRYIGEYKSNADLLYRQTLTVTHGTSLDIEIVDISTKEDQQQQQPGGGNESVTSASSSTTFPSEEMQRADAFIIVYSITDRNSFTFALQILAAIAAQQQQQQQQSNNQQSCQCNHHHHNQQNNSSHIHSNNSQQQQPPSPPPIKPSSIVLLANKNDLEHLRAVEKVEGLAAAMQYGVHFNEISVAENSPELYQSFHTIISNFSQQQSQAATSKRKFSVSKMLGNLRIGRTSPCQQILSQASIVDTSMTSDISSSCSNSSASERSVCTTTTMTTESIKTNSSNGCPGGKVCGHVRNNSSESSSHQSHISSSICHIKSKIVEFHSLKKRHNSPPICSL